MKSYLSLSEIRQDITAGTVNCVDLVNNYLKRIEEKKELNAFLEVFAQEALSKAVEIDLKIKAGNAGRLAGMVLGIKDVICYKDHKVSGSSKILKGFTSLYTATALQRLLDEDVIVIGRLNCDEFAMGGSNENSAYGNVLNPINTAFVPGGSSGGSAAAVKAGLCHATLGSDTGGSIRQPASYCDIVGVKPSYGRISRYGLMAYASSFDQIGPLTNSVEDAALLIEIMAGQDEYDSTVSSEPVAAYTKLLNKKDKQRFAYIKECLERDGVDPEIKNRMQEIIDELKKDGHTVEAVSFPLLDYLVPTYYVLTTAEASSNLSRYTGVIYGQRSQKAKDTNSTYFSSRSEGFGKEVKRRIMLGTFVLSAGYYDAYYAKAQKMRRRILDITTEILVDYDFILLPTAPKTAFRFGENTDPVAMYLEDIFTVQANLTGLPAISLPVGQHSNGMPFGIQLIGRKFEEGNLLAAGHDMCKKLRVLA